MSEEKNEAVNAVVTLVALPIIWASTFAYTVPIREMWLWVVVPVFHAPPVTYAQAWGLLALFSYFKYRSDRQKSTKTSGDLLAEALSIVAMAYASMGVLWVLLRLA